MRELRRDGAAGSDHLRVVFYSHDTVGLGHIRRNVALAAALVRHAEHAPGTGGIDVLLITGNPEATGLPLPPHTDVVTLPTVAKDAGGGYRSRTLSSPLEDVINIRSALIEATVTAFDPDLMVIDKVPLGVGGELLPTLCRLRAGRRTRVVLGLREVLDDPVRTVAEWEAARSTQVITDYYDAVWVYSDPLVFDPVIEYGLPPVVAGKISYTGYLGTGRRQGLSVRGEGGPEPPAGPYALCTVGGGQDGAELAAAFAAAPLPPGWLGVVICGPFMPEKERGRLRRSTAARPELIVHDFVRDADAFLSRAEAVVAMAGYNTACEVLASGRPALLVPRCRPRAEQLIRAKRLAELGAVDTLGDQPPTPDRIGRWLAQAAASRGGPPAAGRRTHRPADLSSPARRSAIDIDGLARIPALAEQLVRAGREQVVHHAA